MDVTLIMSLSALGESLLNELLHSDKRGDVLMTELAGIYQRTYD